MSCVKHGVALTRPCMGFLVAIVDICGLPESNKRLLGQPVLAREELAQLMARTRKMDREDVYRVKWYLVQATNDKCSVLSLSKRESILEQVSFKRGSIFPHMYRLLTFEPLHNLHLESTNM